MEKNTKIYTCNVNNSTDKSVTQQRSISSSSCDSDSNLVKMPILNPSYVSVSDSNCASRCNSQVELPKLSAGDILMADLKPPPSPSSRTGSLKRRNSLRETL